MNKKRVGEDRTVILSDEYLSESGVQGGKILGEHLALGCFIFGIPLLLIGLYGLIIMLFGNGYHTNTTNIVLMLVAPPVIVVVIGLLLIISGYFIYRDKHGKKLVE